MKILKSRQESQQEGYRLWEGRTVLDSGIKDKVAEVDKVIWDKQTEAITEYSEQLARRLVEKITVYDEKLVVEA